MWGARGGRGISMVRGKGGERRVAAGELRLLLPGRHAQHKVRGRQCWCLPRDVGRRNRVLFRR